MSTPGTRTVSSCPVALTSVGEMVCKDWGVLDERSESRDERLVKNSRWKSGMDGSSVSARLCRSSGVGAGGNVNCIGA